MITYTETPTSDITLDDVQQMADLSVASAHEAQSTWSKELFGSLYLKDNQRPNSVVIRGWDGDKLVSMMYVLNQHPAKDASDNTGSKFVMRNKANCDAFLAKYNLSYDVVCLPSLLYVHPDYRGQGIGKATMLAGHNWAKANGYTHIMGYGSYNPQSLSFYKYNSNYTQTDVPHGWDGFVETDSEMFSLIEL